MTGNDERAATRTIAYGAAWKIAIQVATHVARLLVVLILTRLLTPTEFGVAGIALIFTTIVFVFADLGAALVQRSEISEDDRSTWFWLSTSTGVVLCLAGIACAGPMADFFDEPLVEPLFTVVSLTFIVSATTTTPSALLHRDLQFRRIELCNLAAVGAGAILGVIAAFRGAGAWAIVIQHATHSVVYCAAIWRASSWYPRAVFSLASARQMFGFSANLAGANLLTFVHRNADSFLIGRFLGSAQLGIYTLAFNLMLYPVTRFAEPISTAMFPVLSRLGDDEQGAGAKVWLRVSRFVGAIVVPVMLLLIVLAPEFVHVVLGPRWTEAIEVIQILAWLGIVFALEISAHALLIARGATGRFLHFEILNTVAKVAGFAVTVQWGLSAVALSFAFVSTALMWVFIRLTASAAGANHLDYWRALAGVAANGLVMLAVAIPATIGARSVGVPDASILAGVSAIGAGAFILAGRRLLPEVVDDIRGLVRMIRGRGAGQSGHSPSSLGPTSAG